MVQVIITWTRTRLSYMVNTMAADDLVTNEVRLSLCWPSYSRMIQRMIKLSMYGNIPECL